MGPRSPWHRPRFEQRRVEPALELVFDRPGHQHMVVGLAPLDGEIAARQRDRDLAAGPLGAGGADRGGAGGRAAGAGEAGAAFPGPHDQVLARDHLGERNIGAVRENRMMLQQRADLAQIIGSHVVDPEDRMGIAHADRRGGMQNRMVDRPDLQLDRPRVGKLLGERDVGPVEAGLPHVDGGGQRRLALESRPAGRPGSPP